MTLSNLVPANAEMIGRAAELIRKGLLVAMPTETVYGLAANAYDDRAVARIYTAKGRPSFNPLISHVSGKDMAMELVEFNAWAHRLADSFWPGPLTMILPKAKDCPLSQLALAGLNTPSVRCPDHPIALALIEACGVPLVAPSANLSNTVSPTTPAAVFESLGDKVDLILSAGKTEVGVESTIVDLSGEYVTVLRPGAITVEMLEDVLETKVYYKNPATDNSPTAPGQLKRHYATQTPLRLNAVDVKKGEALLAFGRITFMASEEYGAAKDMPEGTVLNLSLIGDLEEAASNLFSYLNALDKVKAMSIAVMPIPNTGVGVAINDRLTRAAAPKEQ